MASISLPTNMVAAIDQASNGNPQIGVRFLPGMPLEPARAGIIATTSPMFQTIRVAGKAYRMGLVTRPAASVHDGIKR